MATGGGENMAYWEQKEGEAILREIKSKNEKDYYSILGLQKNCSPEDVKRAYMKLSLKVHPDKNKSPDADQVFKIVLEAYQRLKEEMQFPALGGSVFCRKTTGYRGWEKKPAPPPNSGPGGGEKKRTAAGNYSEPPGLKCYGCGQIIYGGGRGCRCADNLYKFKPSKKTPA